MTDHNIVRISVENLAKLEGPEFRAVTVAISEGPLDHVAVGFQNRYGALLGAMLEPRLVDSLWRELGRIRANQRTRRAHRERRLAAASQPKGTES